MKRTVLWLLVAVGFVFAPPAPAQDPARGLTLTPDAAVWGNYHALIIGINNYKKWPRLRTAVKDATVIREMLVSRYHFSPKNVIIRTDAAATRFQIERDLRYLATTMRPDDNLFIYYAGHGQLDELTGDGYWVPVDGDLKNPSSWVANSYLKAIVSSEKVQAKNVVVIADSCYSGSLLRGGPSLISLDDRRYQEKLAQKAALRSRQVISSGGVEPVTDGGAGGHSLFAYYLIDALRRNDREVIDLENLFHTKVWKPVTEIGNQRPNVGRLKTPMDQDGQFVLYHAALIEQRQQARPAAPASRPAVSPAAAPPATPFRKIDAEEELWAIVKTSSAVEDYKMFLHEYPDSRFKVHARLRIEQIKRKKNASKMTAAGTRNPDPVGGSKPTAKRPAHAAVAPAAGEKDRAVHRREKTGRYRLALFPINFQSTYGSHASSMEMSSVKGIHALIAKDARLELAYIYKKWPGTPNQAALFPDNEPPRAWKTKSFLADSEPDWEKVKRVGSKIDAELAILMKIVFSTAGGRLDVYCYDYRNDRVYSQLNQGANPWGLATVVENTAVKTIKAFFQRNPYPGPKSPLK